MFACFSTKLSRHGGEGAEKQLFQAINDIRAVCEKAGVGMPQAALSWLVLFYSNNFSKLFDIYTYWALYFTVRTTTSDLLLQSCILPNNKLLVKWHLNIAWWTSKVTKTIDLLFVSPL